MKGEPRGSSTLAVLGMPIPGGGGSSSGDEDREDRSDVEMTAARNLRRALNGDSDEAIVSAFRRMVRACSGPEEDEEDSEE